MRCNNLEMTDMQRSQYIQLETRRTLLIESFSEIAELFSITSSSDIWHALIIYSWVLAIITMFAFNVLFGTIKRKPCESTFFAAFNENIRILFRCQREDTFSTILMGTNRVLRPNREGPTVFLVLVARGAMPTATLLVTLLVHCTLMAYGYPSSEHDVTHLLLDGHQYTTTDDKWPFYERLRKRISLFGIAAVFNFDSLHPQVVKTMTDLVSMTLAPYPESVIILVVDARNNFTEHEKKTLKPNDLGRRFLQEQLGPYFDNRELLNTIKEIGSRCILINPEHLTYTV